MSWVLAIYALGIAATGVWLLIDIRRETPAARVLIVALGTVIALIWPVLLAAAVAAAVWTLARDLLDSVP
jgi:hypothetical protein